MLSTCGKCGGHYFEVQEISASGANFKKFFYQCSSCGVPVGVVDFFDNNELLEKIQRNIQDLNGKIDQIDYSLSNMERKLNNR